MWICRWSPKRFYPVYFSKSVLLEAQIIASRLPPQPASGQRRVLKCTEPTCRRRRRRRLAAGRCCERHSVAGAGNQSDGARDELARDILTRLTPRIRSSLAASSDLKELPETPAAQQRGLYFRTHGGLGAAPLPSAWRGVARMSIHSSCPPACARHGFARGWFAFHRIPAVAERVQTGYLSRVRDSGRSRRPHAG